MCGWPHVIVVDLAILKFANNTALNFAVWSAFFHWPDLYCFTVGLNELSPLESSKSDYVMLDGVHL